ncbi:glycosyltransferase [uncultured Roseibium sp.]|uniref:glycosyltransferase n=1 Tax=uncultured Roseibium sp. TaxID=1936171 RepID=UPI00374D1AFE
MPCAAFPPVVNGGGPISSFILAQLLVDAGHDVRVVHVGDEDRHEIYEGVPVHRIKSPNIYWNYYTPQPAWQKMIWHALENGNPRAYVAMRREIADFKPDIMLTVSIENINVASWAAARTAGIPVAHTVFSTFMMCWHATMQRNGSNCSRQCTSCWLTSLGRRALSRFVDTLLGESHDILKRHIDEGYFPNAVPYRIPAAIDGVHAEEPRRFPRNRPFRVGFLGVHNRFKGFGTLAEAARLTSPDSNIEFYIAGTGHDAFAETTRRQFPAERTNFLGWTSPETFFPEIDVLVYPTIGREAFGRASIEAFSYAIPVISTSIGGVAENITDGVNGFHTPPDDPEALRARIEMLAKDPQTYERLSEGALASASEYLKPHVSGLLCAALHDTLDRHNSRASRDLVEAAR